MRVIYLHGFASSPASTKAERFRSMLEDRGLAVLVPDLNEPCFETLSLSRSIGKVLDLARPEHPAWMEAGNRARSFPAGGRKRSDRLWLVGSSFGGLTAAMAAHRLGARVAGVVLMAPAFDLPRIWDRELGTDGLAEWRQRDALEVDHPAYGSVRYLHWAFYEDAVRHDTSAMALTCPSLVFHGLGDEVVDPQVSRLFAELNPSARVHLVEDGHDLLSSLDFILEKAAFFFDETVGLSGTRGTSSGSAGESRMPGRRH